jgi:hypothetical protein
MDADCHTLKKRSQSPTAPIKDREVDGAYCGFEW